MFKTLSRWLWLLAFNATIATAATADRLDVPQQTQITIDRGAVTAATITAGPSNTKLLLVMLPDGTAELYYLSKAAPAPNPDPSPQPPPTPQRLTIAIVEDPLTVSPQQAGVITAAEWVNAAKQNHDYLGIYAPDAANSATKETPAKLAPFLKAASLRKLPWIMFADAQGHIVWQGNPPATVAELLQLLKRYGG